MTDSLTATKSPPNAARGLVRTLLFRVGGVLVTLVLISFLTFSLMYLAPGDLVKNLMGNRPSSPEAVAAIRAQYHLDDPFLTRYFDWLGAAIQGDFGESIRLQQPVSTVIGGRLGITVTLILLAFLIAAVTAIPLGILSAANEGKMSDSLSNAISLFGLSAPSFAIAILLLYVFAMLVPIFPVYGGGSGGLDTLWHLVLPAIALAAGIGAILMRLTRAAVLRELQGDAVTFARARGLSASVTRTLALRSALIPITTGAGLVLTFIIGSTIIVETVFSLPGLGSLLQQAVFFKDLPVVQALTLLIAAAIAVITILVDLSYLILDPRVRAKELGS